MPETPQLTPFRLEEQSFYFELLPTLKWQSSSPDVYGRAQAPFRGSSFPLILPAISFFQQLLEVVAIGWGVRTWVESGHTTVVRLMAMGRLQTNCTQNIFTLIIKKKIYTLFDFRCVQVPFLSPRHVKFPAQDAGATLHPETCRESPATRSPAGHNAHPCSRGCNVYHHLPCVSAGWDRCQCWLTGKEFLKILPIVPGNVCQLHIALSFIIMILILRSVFCETIRNWWMLSFGNICRLSLGSTPAPGLWTSSGTESWFVHAGSCYFWPLWSIKIWFKKNKQIMHQYKSLQSN